jgi:hypothetical protein
MFSRVLARLFLAASLLVATQLALQHPLDHLKQSTTPAQEQVCGACVAFASVGAAAVSHAVLQIEVAPAGFASVAHAPVFLAAFTPLFRSQAPPAVL